MARMKLTAELGGRTVRSLKVERIAQDLRDAFERKILCRFCGEDLSVVRDPRLGQHLPGCSKVPESTLWRAA